MEICCVCVVDDEGYIHIHTKEEAIANAAPYTVRSVLVPPPSKNTCKIHLVDAAQALRPTVIAQFTGTSSLG